MHGNAMDWESRQIRCMRGLFVLPLALGLLLGGCGGDDEMATEVNPSYASAPIPPIPKIAADAGIIVARPEDPQFDRTKKLATSVAFGARTDPFALLSAEKVYERDQIAARVVSETGNFALLYTPPPPPPDERTLLEPQPYRRLAGVILGDGVVALIEMEDGRVYDVRPGQKVGNTEWVVASIDTEKAVLRRAGNKLPKSIVVRLESRPADFGGGGGGGTGGGAGGGGNIGGGGGDGGVGRPGTDD